jgi:division/cell wall cluster transcriptional repressor MraZ
MPFVGHAEAVIDDKQRVALPAKFRSRWKPETDGPSWFCIPWVPDRVLRLYPEHTFLRLREQFQATSSLTPPKGRAELEALLFSSVEQLDLDGSNRVRLPKWQLDALGWANLPVEIAVLGVGDRLEIRDRAAWSAAFAAGLGRLDVLASQLGG